MKLAIIKEGTKKKHHLKISFTNSKDDLSYWKRGEKFQISPLDGAQYANISSSLQQATGENNARYNSEMKIHHMPIIKWTGIHTNRVKPIVILIST